MCLLLPSGALEGHPYRYQRRLIWALSVWKTYNGYHHRVFSLEFWGLVCVGAPSRWLAVLPMFGHCPEVKSSIASRLSGSGLSEWLDGDHILFFNGIENLDMDRMVLFFQADCISCGIYHGSLGKVVTRVKKHTSRSSLGMSWLRTARCVPWKLRPQVLTSVASPGEFANSQT